MSENKIDDDWINDLTFFAASVRLSDGTFVHGMYAEDDEGWVYIKQPLVPVKVRSEINDNAYRIVYDLYDPFTDDMFITFHSEDIITVTVMSNAFAGMYEQAVDAFTKHGETTSVHMDENDIGEYDPSDVPTEQKPTLH